MPTLLDYPGVSRILHQLLVSCTGHQISHIKSSYEIFFALIWNLSHFLPKFEFSVIHSSVSGAFLHVFHHWQTSFHHYNHKGELWRSVPHVRIYSGITHKRVSQDFRFLEVGISVYVVLHELQTINLTVTSTNEMTKLSANFLECEGAKNDILLWGFSQESPFSIHVLY